MCAYANWWGTRTLICVSAQAHLRTSWTRAEHETISWQLRIMFCWTLVHRTVQSISFPPNLERSFCIVYATRWSLVTLLKIHLVQFCGPPSVLEFYIHILYGRTRTHRAGFSCCSIKCFLNAYDENNDNNNYYNNDNNNNNDFKMYR